MTAMAISKYVSNTILSSLKCKFSNHSFRSILKCTVIWWRWWFANAGTHTSLMLFFFRIFRNLHKNCSPLPHLSVFFSFCFVSFHSLTFSRHSLSLSSHGCFKNSILYNQTARFMVFQVQKQHMIYIPCRAND